MPVHIGALDTTRRKFIYDGVEPPLDATKVSIPLARPDYAFSFAEVVDNPLSMLEAEIGREAFSTLIREQGYRTPERELEGYRGDDGLALYWYLRPDATPGAVKLLLVSFGEYQPGRYIAHFEGVYRVVGAASLGGRT